MTRVVVVGSGFAGVEAVAELSRLGLCESPGECVWVSPGRAMSFQPLIPLVASGRLRVEDVLLSVERYAERLGAQVLDARVERVEPGRLVLENGETLSYDYALIAAGARPAFYGVPGADTYTVPLYSPLQARELYEEVVSGRAGSIAIVGAGFVGVELGAELLWLSREKELGLSVAIIDMLAEPLQLLGNPTASRITRAVLGELGAVLLMNHRVARVEPGKVFFSDGDSVEADIVVWSAGLQGPGIEAPKEAKGRGGFLVVDEYLRVPGLGGRVYAAGDAATIRRGDCIALKMAREAIDSARRAARNIAAAITGSEQAPYRPLITSCFPLAGISLGPGDGVLVVGKKLALRTNIAELYHMKMLRHYQELLGAKA